MAYDLAKVTDNGNQLIAQILANKSSLSIDKIDVSDTQLSASTNIQTMASISNVVQTIQANGYSKNSNSLIISAVLSNEGITADYEAWVFGIWGSDSTNGTSQLIAVITSTNSPDTVPAYSGTTPVELTYKFAIGFSNASNLSINMNSDSFATNDTVVHTTGDETIDGQKKFDTDPTDGAGNAYAKTVDVNQQLDKKVSTNDTVNWQKYPITDVTGSLTAYIGATYQYKSIKQLLDTSVNGFYTTYVDKGVPDTPDSLDNLRGTIQLQSNHVWGILTGELTKVSYYVGGTYNGNTSDLNWIKLANDSAVVHSTDMRKSASDVVGLEDVPNGLYKGSLAKNTDLNTLTQEGIYNFGTSLVNFVDSNNHWGTIQIINKSSVLVQYIICTSNIGDQIFFRTQSGSPATWYPWTMVPRFSTDNSLVLLNGEKITPANDTTVIHKDPNTGNTSEDVNFIGKAQKDNKDLLTADQLPSDLARTGQDTNFTDKLQQAGSDVITQGKFVQSDSETGAQSVSSNDSSGFYYTEEAD
ncbi:pyocin knob domain-containing protein [Lentilactobacillus hilgardii]|uniref:pyocin knob domain-containing protein n=1 Tax=Lentilactobacillus hilgardii TaxID=1588 RepID=UPI00390C7AAF